MPRTPVEVISESPSPPGKVFENFTVHRNFLQVLIFGKQPCETIRLNPSYEQSIHCFLQLAAMPFSLRANMYVLVREWPYERYLCTLMIQPFKAMPMTLLSCHSFKSLN